MAVGSTVIEANVLSVDGSAKIYILIGNSVNVNETSCKSIDTLAGSSRVLFSRLFR